MFQPAIVALLAAVVGVQGTTAPPPRKPAAAPPVVTPVPVPRTDFIRTMDAEFGKMDVDRNKVVTKAEIEQFQRAAAVAAARARARALFAQLDSDKNGQLTPGEFDRVAVATAPPSSAPVLREADLNKDGTITIVEYRTAKLANFDGMDADKDGVVSVAEMKAAGLVK